MQQTVDKALVAMAWPGLLVAGAVLGQSHVSVPLPWLVWLPYGTLILTAALAWRFHASRPFLTCAVLAGLLGVLQHPLAGPVPRLVPFCLGVAVPVALGTLAFLSERGIATVHGLWRMLGLAALALGVAHEVQYPNDWALHLAHTATVVEGVFGLAAVAGLVRVWFFPSPFESSTVGVLVASWLALTTATPGGREIYVLAGACMTLVALVQHSYGMAFIDELTGIPGRRALKQELAGLAGRYAIAMVDIDHFKGFNDTYGHDVGDQCLRLVASRLSKVTGGGKAFRYGGEEFTILFPSRSAGDAIEPLEAIRKAIEGNPMVLRGANRPSEKPKAPQPRKGPVKKVTVTVSIGVSECKQNAPEEVIKAADKALYKAKKKGRNQVCKG